MYSFLCDLFSSPLFQVDFFDKLVKNCINFAVENLRCYKRHSIKIKKRILVAAHVSGVFRRHDCDQIN